MGNETVNSALEKAIDHIAEQIKIYRATPFDDGDSLVKVLQQLTSTLYYLEGQRSRYHKVWQETVNNEVLAGNSVSRAENVAHVNTPELYHLRRIMEAGYKVVDAIRTQISWLKTEKSSVS